METDEPLVAAAPAAGVCEMTSPAATVVLVARVTAPSVSPTVVRAVVAADSVSPTTLGTVILAGPDETTMETVAPEAVAVPAAGF